VIHSRGEVARQSMPCLEWLKDCNVGLMSFVYFRAMGCFFVSASVLFVCYLVLTARRVLNHKLFTLRLSRMKYRLTILNVFVIYGLRTFNLKSSLIGFLGIPFARSVSRINIGRQVKK
jgi:hypothetical protein